jgi:hypothetical protein
MTRNKREMEVIELHVKNRKGLSKILMAPAITVQELVF